MTLVYRYLILCSNSHHQNEVCIQKPCHNITRSKTEYVPKRAKISSRGTVIANHSCKPVECTHLFWGGVN